MTADTSSTPETAPRRKYVSPRRAQQAAETRAAVVEAAAEAFIERGYAGATLASIAKRAGVSTETVSHVGSKASLLLEAHRARYAGEGGWASVLERPEIQSIFQITDPDEAATACADFLERGHRRSARLWLMIRVTSATDDQVAEEFAELRRLKGESFRETARWLLRVGAFAALDPSARTSPDGLDEPAPELVAEVDLLMSAETYTVLTADHGFGPQAYRRWVETAIRRLHI